MWTTPRWGPPVAARWLRAYSILRAMRRDRPPCAGETAHERTDGDDRRRGAGADAGRARDRPDVRHGRIPAPAVLRRRAPARHRPQPRQRRALRRVRRRRVRQGERSGRGVRRDARPRRHQPDHRHGRGAQRRYPAGARRRRQQPRPLLEEHDPGVAADGDPAPGREGADPDRGDSAHPRARAPCFLRRDARAARSGGARHPRGHRPRPSCVRARGPHRRSELPGRAVAAVAPETRNRSRPRRPSCGTRNARSSSPVAGCT